MIESLAGAGRDIVLLYGVRTVDDLVFASELRALSARCHFVLSHSANAAGAHEHGHVDGPMLARLVPDVEGREVFICGPPPMMVAVAAALRTLRVPDSSIHYEQFG